MQNADVVNMLDMTKGKSDQLNAADLIAAPMVLTITRVVRNKDKKRPMFIYYQNDDGKPYKPCLGFRIALIKVMGENGNNWVGRNIRVYNEPSVMFGDAQTGGIRVSHVDNIDAPIELQLPAGKGRLFTHTIYPLVIQSQKIEPVAVLSTDQLTVICDLIYESKVPIETVLERYKVATKEQIPATAYDTLVKNLKIKIEENKQQSE